MLEKSNPQNSKALVYLKNKGREQVKKIILIEKILKNLIGLQKELSKNAEQHLNGCACASNATALLKELHKIEENHIEKLVRIQNRFQGVSEKQTNQAHEIKTFNFYDQIIKNYHREVGIIS